MTTKPRIIFMGTPAFALPALDLLHSHLFPIIAVVTQPDSLAGRGQKKAASPVKLWAQKLGLPVVQPLQVKDIDFINILQKLQPDLAVVAAFGQILPKAILDLPPLGCLNIHPSLLPKYRGAAPINWSIIRGETQTGVTIMLMDEGMDSGDILTQQETPVAPAESYGLLHDRLAQLGAKMLLQTIEKILAGDMPRQPQDASAATFAPRLTKETGKILWNQKSSAIVNLIRGLAPSPAAYTFLDGQMLKIFSAEAKTSYASHPPGFVASPHEEGLPVASADGYVILKEVQLAGKKKMTIGDFLRGRRLPAKTVLS